MDEVPLGVGRGDAESLEGGVERVGDADHRANQRGAAGDARRERTGGEREGRVALREGGAEHGRVAGGEVDLGRPRRERRRGEEMRQDERERHAGPRRNRRATNTPRGGGTPTSAKNRRHRTTTPPRETRARARARRVDGRHDEPRAKTSSFKSDAEGVSIRGVPTRMSTFFHVEMCGGRVGIGACVRGCVRDTQVGILPQRRVRRRSSRPPPRSSRTPRSGCPPRDASPLEDHLLGHRR